MVQKRKDLIGDLNFLKKLAEHEIVINKKLKQLEKSDFQKTEINKVLINILYFSDKNELNILNEF